MDLFNLSILAVTLVMMLSVGLSLEGREMAALSRRPWALMATVAVHWVVMPFLAVAIARVLPLDPLLSSSLLLLAACPVGDIIGYYTLVGRGSVPLAVSLNALSCLLAPLGMAIVFMAYRAFAPGHPSFGTPGWALVARVLALAVVPIALGMMVRSFRPLWAHRGLAPCSRLAGIGILGVLAWALFRQRETLETIWPSALPAVILFLLAGLAVGAGWGWLGRLPHGDALAVSVSFPVRNTGLAAALATTLLGRPDFLALFALYFLLEVPLFLLGARVWRAFTEGD